MADPRTLIPPPAEPLSLDDIKLQLRLDTDITVDDPTLRGYIAAARQHVEDATRRQLVLATYRLTVDCFPSRARGGSVLAPQVYPNAHVDDGAIVLFGGPLQTITSIAYTDTAGTTTTLSTADYVVDAENDPARIMPSVASGGWPDTQGGAINAVQVNAAAGWMTPVSVNATTDVLTLAAGARALEAGQAVQLVAIDGTLPAPLAARTNYYAVNVTGLTFQLSLTPGGSVIDLTDTGQGIAMIDGCPEAIRQALRILVTHFYENRGDKSAEIPMAVGALLSPWKVWRF